MKNNKFRLCSFSSVKVTFFETLNKSKVFYWRKSWNVDRNEMVTISWENHLDIRSIWSDNNKIIMDKGSLLRFLVGVIIGFTGIIANRTKHLRLHRIIFVSLFDLSTYTSTFYAYHSLNWIEIWDGMVAHVGL